MNILLFVDDQAVLTGSDEKLKQALHESYNVSCKYILSISVSKTKAVAETVMV